MDYINPSQLVEDVAKTGAYKSSLSIKEILVQLHPTAHLLATISLCISSPFI
ncbi:MAG: hypothetical protein ACQEXB_12035 [Bacillota bacterium]